MIVGRNFMRDLRICHSSRMGKKKSSSSNLFQILESSSVLRRFKKRKREKHEDGKDLVNPSRF